MPFQKGNKLSPGGKRGNKGGRPTREQQAKKQSFLEALIKERDKQAAKLAIRYFEMAQSDPPTMRHAVDKIMPNPKVDVEHSGTVIHELKTNVPDEEDPF